MNIHYALLCIWRKMCTKITWCTYMVIRLFLVYIICGEIPPCQLNPWLHWQLTFNIQLVGIRNSMILLEYQKYKKARNALVCLSCVYYSSTKDHYSTKITACTQFKWFYIEHNTVDNTTRIMTYLLLVKTDMKNAILILGTYFHNNKWEKP